MKTISYSWVTKLEYPKEEKLSKQNKEKQNSNQHQKTSCSLVYSLRILNCDNLIEH